MMMLEMMRKKNPENNMKFSIRRPETDHGGASGFCERGGSIQTMTKSLGEVKNGCMEKGGTLSFEELTTQVHKQLQAMAPLQYTAKMNTINVAILVGMPGVGKSQSAKAIRELAPDSVCLIEEPVMEWMNHRLPDGTQINLLEQFYDGVISPAIFGIHTALTGFREILKGVARCPVDGTLILDGGFAGSVGIYAPHYISEGRMSPSEAIILKGLQNTLLQLLPIQIRKPDLLVVMNCVPEIALERIQLRGVETEIDHLSVGELEKMGLKSSEFFLAGGMPFQPYSVHLLDSGRALPVVVRLLLDIFRQELISVPLEINLLD